MKKLGLIMGGGVLLIGIVITAAGLWVKANMQDIAYKMTGMDIRFANLDLHYAPMPLIVLTDLALNHDANSAQVRKLELYPDLTKAFHGQISFKKAILEEPLIVVQAPGGNETQASADKSAPPTALLMNAVPDGVMVVHNGQIVLQSPQGDRLPVMMTAQAEKVDQQLSIQLQSASIDEIGLTFTGEVSITSFAPPKLRINATDGSFNARALKDFLLKFGYLNNETADRIPAVERIHASGLTVVFDAATKDLAVTAQTLEADHVLLHQVAAKLSGGAFELDCTAGEADAGSMHGWIQQNPNFSKTLDNMLARAALKSLNPQGVIRISALHLRSDPSGSSDGKAMGPMDGAVDLAAQNLILHLVAQNGQEQRLTISQLKSKVTIAHDKPSVQVEELTFESSKGGTGRISGYLPAPLDLKRMTVQSTVDSLKVFETSLNLHLDKTAQPQTKFNLALKGPTLNVFADGLLLIPGLKQNDVEARLSYLRIIGPASDNRVEPHAPPSFLAQPFGDSLIMDKPMSARAFVKALELGTSTRLQDVDLQLACAGEHTVFHGTAQMSGVKLILDTVVSSPSHVVTTVQTQGTDVDLTALIACFSNTLPVYLTGHLYINGSFAANGDTPQTLIEVAQGEATLVVTQASVQRLSSLDSRLGFFLDILKSARISSEAEDTISLSKSVVNVSLQKDRLMVDRFSMTGPLLSAWGSGEFSLKDKHLKLTGGVKSALGLTKAFEIDRILEKEGA